MRTRVRLIWWIAGSWFVVGSLIAAVAFVGAAFVEACCR